MSVGFFDSKPSDLSHIDLSSLFSVDRCDGQWNPLSRLFAKVMMKFLSCCCVTANNNEEWVKPFHLRLVKPWPEQVLLDYFPWGLKAHDYCYFHEETGLKVSVFENQTEVIIAFGAHNSGNTELPQERQHATSEKQVETIKENLWGGEPYLYSEAVETVRALMRHPRFLGKKTIVCGQSFGGSIAEYVGLTLKTTAYCFNSIMLGKGLLKKIPQEHIEDAHSYISVISVEEDFASHLLDSGSLYRWTAWALGLPQHMGFKYVFAFNDPSMLNRHVYLMGELMHWLGYPCRTRTSDLPSHELLPQVFTHEELQREVRRLSRVVTALNKYNHSFCNDDLRESLIKIKTLHSELYGFLCFSVWMALGRRDCGAKGWGEKCLLDNPQLLHMIANPKKTPLLQELICHYDLLIRIAKLIPFIEEFPSLEERSLVAQDFVQVLHHQLGIRDFKINPHDLLPFIAKWQFFLSDQLKNRFGEEMKRIQATMHPRGEYPVTPKLSLLATRFQIPSSQRKRILVASVEYLGLLKVGGLADAVRGITLGLKQQGHEVTLIFPKFERFPQDKHQVVSNSIRKTQSTIKHHFEGPREDRLFQGAIEGVPVFFIEHTCVEKGEWDRFKLGDKGVYQIAGDDLHAQQLKERFAYFGSALAGFIHERRGDFDGVMFHDWHGALAIHLLVQRYFQTWMQREIPALIYVFHNNGYAAQGVLDKHSKPLFDKLELNTEHLNVSEQSLRFADHCCTVSPTYAEEVQHREGNGLAASLKEAARRGKLTGILNGANANAFNPATDPQLMGWIDVETQLPCPLNFGPEDDLSISKARNKKQLQQWICKHHPDWIEQFAVDVTREKIVTFVGRFDSSQKGLEKLRWAMYAAKDQGATLIVMGSYSTEDDTRARQILSDLQEEAKFLKGSDWGGALILIDEINPSGKYNFQEGTMDGIPGIGSLVRSITTFGFFPSRYEPCGSVQFETWAFGGLVIATAVGGFADTVTSHEGDPAFNGLTCPRFEDWDCEAQGQEMKATVNRALNYWNGLDSNRKQGLMSAVMQQARLAGWNSSVFPQGLSPIAHYERVLEQAIVASKNRVSIEDVEFFK